MLRFLLNRIEGGRSKLARRLALWGSAAWGFGGVACGRMLVEAVAGSGELFDFLLTVIPRGSFSDEIEDRLGRAGAGFGGGG